MMVGSISRGRAAAFGALAILGMLIGWVLIGHQRAARMGEVRFATDGPMIAARIATDSGWVAIPPLALPAAAPIRLPEGTYRIEATRPGALSSSALFDVARGRTNNVRIDLSVGQMGRTIPIGHGDRFGFVDFGGRRDLLVARETDRRVARHDLVANRQVWDAEAIEWPSGVEPLAEARRLDADDEPDVIFSGEQGLIALSGRTGARLWTIKPIAYQMGEGPARWLADIDGDGADDLAWMTGPVPGIGGIGHVEARSGRDGHRLWERPLESWPSYGIPLVVADLAGRAAVIATSASKLVALDAITGRPRFDPIDLGGEHTSPPIPLDRDGDRRHDHLLAFGEQSHALIDGRDGRAVGAGTWPQKNPPGAPLRWLDADRLLQVATAGSSIADDAQETIMAVGSASTGSLAWTARMPADGFQYAQDSLVFPVADVNGDGCRDVIASRRVPVPIRPFPPSVAAPDPGPDLGTEPGDRWAIEAVDGTNGKVLWSVPMRTLDYEMARAVEPVAFGPDIDGDGVPEVFVASLALRTPRTTGRWGDWMSQMDPFHADPRLPFDPPLARHWVFVDAISGATGTRLWWFGRELVAVTGSRLPPLLWWSRGPDHSPALVVRHDLAAVDPAIRESSQTWILRAEDGALLHQHSGDGDLLLDDLDEDGLEELIVVRSRRQVAGAVTAFRGRRPAAWRRWGSWQVTPDLDGDGVEDLLGDEGLANRDTMIGDPTRPEDRSAGVFALSADPASVRAVSSADGRSLWRLPATPAREFLLMRPGDFDGDGVADFLGDQLPPWAISGKTGRPPGSGDLPASLRKRLVAEREQIPLFRVAQPPPWVADLDGDGVGEILFAFQRLRFPEGTPPPAADYGIDWEIIDEEDPYPPRPESGVTALAAVDGRSGALRWQAVLASGPGQVQPFTRVRMAQLDGDPGLDLATLSIDPTTPLRFRLRALRGRDGRELWSRVVANKIVRPGHSADGVPALAVADLDVDGLAEVLIGERVDEPTAVVDEPDDVVTPIGPSRFVVRALESRDGSERWAWNGPSYPALELHPDEHFWVARIVPARRAEGLMRLRVDLLEQFQRTDAALVREQFLLDARGRLIDARKHEDSEAWLDLPPEHGGIVAGLMGDSWVDHSPDLTAQVLGALAVGDPDGDGVDALAWYDPIADRLGQFAPDRLEPTWQRQPFPQSLGVASLALRWRGDRATVTATQEIDATTGPLTETFDLATGEPIPAQARVPLAAGRTHHLVSDQGTSWVEISGDVPIPLRIPGRDPRLARSLPWTDRFAIDYVIGSMPAALVLLGLPGWAGIRAVRRRSLGRALVAVAGIAAAIAAFRQSWLPSTIDPDHLAAHHRAAEIIGAAYLPIYRATEIQLDPRWVRASVGLPLVTAALACWAWRRRSGRLLIAFAVASALVALGGWSLDWRWREPDEYDHPRGWPWIGFWGVYALGIGAMTWSFLRGMWSLRRRRGAET